jgi:hypothetical protein
MTSRERCRAIGGESHPLQQAAQRLRLRSREFDELDAIHAQRIAGLGVVLLYVHRFPREARGAGARAAYFTRFR